MAAEQYESDNKTVFVSLKNTLFQKTNKNLELTVSAIIPTWVVSMAGTKQAFFFFRGVWHFGFEY